MQPSRRTAGAAIVATTAAALGAAALVAGAPPAGAQTRGRVTTSAAAYGNARGYRVGIAVYDTKTGSLYTAGHATSAFISASVVKVLVATRLLVAGKMHGSTATLAYKMITQSDNNATDQLYPQAGGDALVAWTKRYFQVPDLGSATTSPGLWGETELTPRGLVEFYAKVEKDKKVEPWLLNAMHHIRKTSSAGEYQWWGLPSATTHAAVKQGWNLARGHANVNTTGFVDGDRYAVAILTQGPTRTYLKTISALVTHTAELLLPGGVFPDPVPSVSVLSTHTGPVVGGTAVTIRGMAFTHVTAVYFGSQRARITVRSAVRIDAVAPKHVASTINVRIVTSHGTSVYVKADRFTFQAPAP